MRIGPSCRTHSALYKPFTDSAKELSKLSPTVPIKATAPASVSRSEYRIEVYWVPASLWWMRPLTVHRPRSGELDTILEAATFEDFTVNAPPNRLEYLFDGKIT